ncbi:MAG: type I 3-dehydroquinate dehydratase [Spirochaetaceae bacterium]|jgi:3-dehydroquinate dehydratase/shikimate dehydrogenase|nr:type I 3-dehydroquinate dehydratase [Spirochaetaceae bacterium]
MGAKICLCLTGKTLRRDLQVIEKYRKYIDLVELRVDCLDPVERFDLRPFPEQADLPVILTIRRKEDGGNWCGGESTRITLLAKGLAFAQTDRRRNFAYVDIEEDLSVPGIEEVARAFGTRIIRSFHNIRGTDSDLTAKIRGLCRFGDEIAKVAVMANTLSDVQRLWRAAKDLQNREKILISMGPLGAGTRILADRMGSSFTYTSAKDELGFPQAASGQIDPKELVECYHFRSLDGNKGKEEKERKGEKTAVLGITGYPLTATDSPKLHNAMYPRDSLDAVYLPFPAAAIGDFLSLADEIGLHGASVTVPHKEAILPHLAFASPEVKHIGACNTIVRRPDGWHGYNTDAEGFSSSLLAFIYGDETKMTEKQRAKRNLRGKKITVVGAGGAARAIVAEIHRLKGKALVLNRTPANANELATRYGFRWGCLDEFGAVRTATFNDIIIQTTPIGMEGDTGDPFPLYQFTGREIVYDIIYKPERTPFLRRAQEAGCKILNGYDMLVRQAIGQHRIFFDLPE